MCPNAPGWQEQFQSLARRNVCRQNPQAAWSRQGARRQVPPTASSPASSPGLPILFLCSPISRTEVGQSRGAVVGDLVPDQYPGSPRASAGPHASLPAPAGAASGDFPRLRVPVVTRNVDGQRGTGLTLVCRERKITRSASMPASTPSAWMSPAVHPEKFVQHRPCPLPGRGNIREALFDMVPDIAFRNILSGIDQRNLHG